MSTLTHPSYVDIHKGCQHIYNDFLGEYIGEPSIVVGLTRGGLMPSVVLSHMFNVPHAPVSYTSSVGKGGKTMYADTKLERLPNTTENSVIFVLDDIADSGNTLLEVINFYKRHYTYVYSAALYYKLSSAFKPNCYWQEIPEDGPWIIFPWEAYDGNS